MSRLLEEGQVPNRPASKPGQRVQVRCPAGAGSGPNIACKSVTEKPPREELPEKRCAAEVQSRYNGVGPTAVDQGQSPIMISDSDQHEEPLGGHSIDGEGHSIDGEASEAATRESMAGPSSTAPRSATQLIFRRFEIVEQDATTSLPTQPPAVESSGSSGSAAASREKRHRPDPLAQSLMLLLTMAVMLTAARFAVPRVVEEMRYAWTRGELRAEHEAGTRGLHNVSLDALSEAYQMITAAVGPSVVHIDVQRRQPDLLETGTRSISTSFVPLSDQGSGVVVDDDGHILTNRHVIVSGDEIKVTLSDGRRVDATVVGTDPLTDLAVLQVKADRLFPIAWGNSDRCRVGSPVWAIGSPFGLDQTVTFGIVSGKHRMVRAASDASERYGSKAQYQDFMQSDVAVNPGNSGGPLVDSKGTLVGINTAIVGETFQGVSFSIPSNVARQVYERIKETGQVERGWLGVILGEVPDELLAGDDHRVRGALITGVAASDSPAASAGLLRGDVITKVGPTQITDSGHLIRVIGGELGGSSVRMGIHRDGKSLEITVLLGVRPDEIDQR